MLTRITLLTGASSGIGADLARIFAANGHRLALVARRVERLEALAAEIVAAGGPAPLVIPVDLLERNSGDAIVAALAEAGVDVDVLVNNAGYGLIGDLVDIDRADQLCMIDCNIRALTDLTARFAPGLIRNRGALLNVSSIAGFLPGPGMAVYYASKAFVLSFTEAMHSELGRHGVRVTALCPGPVESGFQARAGIHARRDPAILYVSSAEVARQAYAGLMAGKRVVLPGVGVKIIALLMRLLPRGIILAGVGRFQRSRQP